MSEDAPNNKSEKKKDAKANDSKPSDRIVQIMPATGWRAFEFTQDEAGKTESREVAVVGWGLRENGEVSILVSHPNASDGHAAISISDAPSFLGEREGNKVAHYQAVAPNQDLAEVTKEAEFILGFLRSKQPPKPKV
jgi:hypothetical protein